MDYKEKKRYAEYDRLVKEKTSNSQQLTGYLRAFWVGGVICVIGQLISMFGANVLRLSLTATPAFTSITLVFLGTFLTGLGIYDRIGSYAGAGSVVPITGFANSVAAPAMEFRREGMVFGVGGKLFSLAGPVLVYGTTSSVLVGICHWIRMRWFS